ncbi:hypothetical protein CVT26_004174 [Gymnopilus dilepis]|uniref:Uncharacterized protein n=1 Tax=Gymnopilus dilepis TaxID=231916 RepID=A0A409YMJ9_9AGAR|nr:hypothetical protein CVT26_004174 [Gymnopilus dilepis]
MKQGSIVLTLSTPCYTPTQCDDAALAPCRPKLAAGRPDEAKLRAAWSSPGRCTNTIPSRYPNTLSSFPTGVRSWEDGLSHGDFRYTTLSAGKRWLTLNHISFPPSSEVAYTLLSQDPPFHLAQVPPFLPNQTSLPNLRLSNIC